MGRSGTKGIEIMEKILTIVVPTYNAQDYLRDNLESFLIPELLSDIEVLIINDGSTDHSLDIAMEYVNKYPDTYRVITKENGGHGSGINCGIAHAKGYYFKVVDADDWVDKDAFVKLVKALKEKDTDIVYSGFLWTYDNGEKDKTLFKTEAEIRIPFEGVDYQKVYKFDDIADRLYIKMHSMTVKTEILRDNHITIDEHCYYVDAEYILYPIPYIETISFVDAFVYYYRIGNAGQSVSMEKMQKNEKNYDKVINSLLAFYQDLTKSGACSEAKRSYIAGIIARIVAGKIKIMLSFPASRQKKEELRAFDRKLSGKYPKIYDSNKNKAVDLLRKSRYLLYGPASALVRRKYS